MPWPRRCGLNSPFCAAGHEEHAALAGTQDRQRGDVQRHAVHRAAFVVEGQRLGRSLERFLDLQFARGTRSAGRRTRWSGSRRSPLPPRRRRRVRRRPRAPRWWPAPARAAGRRQRWRRRAPAGERRPRTPAPLRTLVHQDPPAPVRRSPAQDPGSRRPGPLDKSAEIPVVGRARGNIGSRGGSSNSPGKSRETVAGLRQRDGAVTGIKFTEIRYSRVGGCKSCHSRAVQRRRRAKAWEVEQTARWS